MFHRGGNYRRISNWIGATVGRDPFPSERARNRGHLRIQLPFLLCPNCYFKRNPHHRGGNYYVKLDNGNRHAFPLRLIVTFCRSKSRLSQMLGGRFISKHVDLSIRPPSLSIAFSGKKERRNRTFVALFNSWNRKVIETWSNFSSFCKNVRSNLKFKL